MAINTNDGTGLKDLPATLAVPQNIGKLDVQGIYDRVVQGLTAGTDLAQNPSEQQASGAILANKTAQAFADRSLIPSATGAALATNQATAAQAPLQTNILAQKSALASATEPSEAGATVAKNDADALSNDVAKVYAQANLKYAPTVADDVAQLQQGLVQRLKASGTGMVTSPLTGPNGQPLGSLIAYVGPDGQPKTQVVPVPYGQLSRINTGVKYLPIGQKIDPTTNQPVGMQWQTVLPNAAGGITKGEIVTTGLNDGPPGDLYQAPGAAPAAGAAPPAAGAAPPVAGAVPPAAGAVAPAPGASPAPIQGPSAIGTAVPGGRVGAEVAAKQVEERAKVRQDFIDGLQEERDLLDKSNASIGKLRNDISAEQNSSAGSGPVVGSEVGTKVRSALGDPSAAAVQGDLSNFVSQVMASAKNIRTQREFNAFTGAIPAPNDPKEVQNDKLAYLSTATNVLKTRTDYVDGLLRTNPTMDPDQADAAAIAKFPLPTEPPGGWSVGAKTAAPAAASGAGGEVRVTAPDGTVGTVPAANLQQFLAQGYKQAQ